MLNTDEKGHFLLQIFLRIQSNHSQRLTKSLHVAGE